MRAVRWIVSIPATSPWQTKSTQASKTVEADRLFLNSPGQTELADFVGKTVWKRVAACSGFARAAAGYHAVKALAKLHPATGSAETFQWDTLILPGPHTRLCFAAPLETE